jgi:hypothetical protein
LDLPGGDIERGDQSLRPMALVFIVPPLDLAGFHGQARCGSLQRLYAAHLVDRHRADTLFSRFRGLNVEFANLGTFRLEVRIRFRRNTVHLALSRAHMSVDCMEEEQRWGGFLPAWRPGFV